MRPRWFYQASTLVTPLIPCSNFTCSALAIGQSWGTRIRTEPKTALAISKTPLDPQIDAQFSEELNEIATAWANLHPALKAAVLVLVRADTKKLHL